MKKILKLERHLPEFETGASVRAALILNGIRPDSLKRFGFVDPFNVGQTVLPSIHLGSVARRNASGYEQVHRDQPMEEMTRLLSWRRKEWHGSHQVEVDDFVQRTYRRYPRSYIAGDGIEFTIVARDDGRLLIASPIYDTSDAADAETLRTAANLLLEGFGEMEFLHANLFPVLSVPIKRLNWDVFPKGQVPWDRVNAELDRVIASAAPSAQPVIRTRTRQVEDYGPNFAAIGRAGFSGYWVFGFTDYDLYVLESRTLDNATYILGSNWETVSQLTKAEVINSQLARARLIHDRSWSEKLDQALRHVLRSKAA